MRERLNILLVIVFTLLIIECLQAQVIAIDTIQLGAGNNPCDISVNPYIKRIYVSCKDNNMVFVIDETSNSVIDTILLNQPRDISINSKTNRIYITQIGKISIIDGFTNSVMDSVTIEDYAVNVCVNPLTNRIYVTAWKRYAIDQNRVYVIDGITDSITTTIPVGEYPDGISINLKLNYIYIANWYGSSVYTIAGTSDSIIAALAVAQWPYGICVNPKTNYVYVAHYYHSVWYNSNLVSVIDETNNSVLATVITGTSPRSVCVNPENNRVYVANEVSNDVYVIDGTSFSVADIIPVGVKPYSIDVNPTNNRIYVTCYEDEAIYVLEDLVGIEEPSFIPESFSLTLLENPVKEKAIFHLNLSEDVIVTLRIYDIMGRLIDLLINERKTAGFYEISWIPEVSAGVYFYVLETAQTKKSGKIVLIK